MAHLYLDVKNRLYTNKYKYRIKKFCFCRNLLFMGIFANKKRRIGFYLPDNWLMFSVFPIHSGVLRLLFFRFMGFSFRIIAKMGIFTYSYEMLKKRRSAVFNSF